MKSLAYIPASNQATNASLMTVQSVRASGASDIIVNTVTGAPTKFFASMGEPHTFIDPVTAESITIISEATAVDFAGHLDSGKVVIDAIAPGYVDTRGSLVGDIVVIRPITEWANNIFNLLSESLNDDGTIKDSAITYNPNIGDYVQSGGIWSLVSGLNGQMTALVGWITGRRGTVAAIASRAFTASKDTYVDVLRNTTTGVFSIVYTEVANGAAAPALAANSLRLGKLVTNGSTITSFVQIGLDSLFNTIYPNGAISSQNINRSGLYADIYIGNGLGAPGEFANTTRKTYDISSIPDGANFSVSAQCNHGDATYGNVRAVVTYNGTGYSSTNYGQYGISAIVALTLKKVAGQNSVTIASGGNRTQNVWSTIGQCS